MNQHSRDLANELARRAIEAAERTERDDPTPQDVAHRLAEVADRDGRVRVEEALEVLTRFPGSVDPLRTVLTSRAERRQALAERFFPSSKASENPIEGDA
jgi:hypothetical protein